MPHFYGVTNNHPDVLPLEQKKFPDAEIRSVAFYLFQAIFVERNNQPARAYAFDLGQKEAIRVTPVVLNLGGAGDAIIGADVFGNRAISIDYASGLLIYQKEGIHPEAMTLYRFSGEPRFQWVSRYSPGSGAESK